jgi:hypothetical protein
MKLMAMLPIFAPQSLAKTWPIKMKSAFFEENKVAEQMFGTFG